MRGLAVAVAAGTAVVAEVAVVAFTGEADIAQPAVPVRAPAAGGTPARPAELLPCHTTVAGDPRFSVRVVGASRWGNFRSLAPMDRLDLAAGRQRAPAPAVDRVAARSRGPARAGDPVI